MKRFFKNLDLNNFWSDNNYYDNPNPITQQMIDEAEAILGFKLPLSYIELLKIKNGGIPKNNSFLTKDGLYFCFENIYGIGGGDLDLARDSVYMIEEWEYPVIGILIADCRSAGHDSIFLDYSECGNIGEPKVVHIDLESGSGDKITILANDFETFIEGLIVFDDDVEYEN